MVSCSHRRRYYALQSAARFDSHGLWSYEYIRFSSCGTFLAAAPGGLHSEELDRQLGVRTHPQPGPVAAALFTSLLNAKQRRLFVGLAALLWGRDGDRHVEEWLGLHPRTVSRGRRELLSGGVDANGVRNPGGWRTPFEKTGEQIRNLPRPA